MYMLVLFAVNSRLFMAVIGKLSLLVECQLSSNVTVLATLLVNSKLSTNNFFS